MPLGDLVLRALEGGPAAPSREDVQALCRGGHVAVDERVIRDVCLSVPPGLAVSIAGCAEPDEASATAPVRVLVPWVPWRKGALNAGGKAPGLRFVRVAERAGVAELRIECDPGSVDARARLAAVGWSVLGDVHHGGILVRGGARVRSDESPEPDGWWPDEPVFPGADTTEVWRVSAATRRAVERGHPWLLDDDNSEDVSRFAPGTLVAVADDRGEFGLAYTDGGRRVAARVWARNVARSRDAKSVEERVAGAVDRRRPLLELDPQAGSDVVRIVHGEADGLPGLAIDRIGPLLRVLQSSRACEPFATRAIDAAVRGMAPWLGEEPPVISVLHHRDHPKGELECVTAERGRPGDVLAPDGSLVVTEWGLRFRVDPGWSAPQRSSPGFGLYADQRDNRRRVARIAERGGRWLNLFAHTGAFSVALLAAGADEVVSVDLSRGYLRWLEDNLALNSTAITLGVAGARHEAAKHDGRRFLERAADASFDGIILDPPTAAAAGRRYWSVERDLEAMIGLAFAKLRPRGVLLVTRNRQSKRRSLRASVEKAGRWRSVDDAPPADDFPRLRGFPEGDAFEGILAERR